LFGIAESTGRDHSGSTRSSNVGVKRGHFDVKEAIVESVIANWLKRYDSGALSRRQLIQGLAMLATAAATAPAEAAAFEISAIDHIQINASHAKKSAEWYAQVFGLQVMRTGAEASEEIAQVGTANSLLLSIRKLSPAGKVDHIAFRTNVARDVITRDLKARGVNYAPPDKNLAPGDYVVDPDGVRIQLMPKPETK
jgi:catechol 2,3-dioxygenase-like lactoylglutathione lyase family enzyme